MPRSPKALALGWMFLITLFSLQVRQIRSILANPNPELSKGAVAPVLELTGADGTPIPAAAFRGHPLVVSFWAAWCAPCRKELPEVAAIVEKWNSEASPRDRVVLVAVNQGDDPSSLSMFLEDTRLRSARFAFDRGGDASERWKVRALPTTVFVDRNGNVRDTQEGYDVAFTDRLSSLFREERAAEMRP
jgi:thiol-disulfide isomerase/thioredoxin